jgi:putrescine transport system permease protein
VSVWGGFSTSWYTQLLHNDQILDAAWLSLEIGVVVSTGAVMLGTLAAIALVRFAVSAAGCCSPAWSTRRW